MNENINPNTNPAPKQKREYSPVEAVFAWLCILFGYFYCRVFTVVNHPFYGMLFTLSIFLVTAVILKLRGAHFTASGIFFAVTALAVQFSLLFSSNDGIHYVAYNYGLAVYLYFVYSSLGNSIEKGVSDFVLIDFFKSVIMPFAAFSSLFSGIGSSLGNRGGRQLLRVILGIALAFIPTAIIISLLSYDAGFSKIMKGIFDWSFDDIISQVFSVVFAFPVGMYLYGLFISSADKKLPEVMSRDKCVEAGSKLRIAPAVTVSIAVIPVIAVYIVFFVSQWQYYVSGFSGVLPKGFSFATYAREGFFQLCTVSFINLFILTAVGVFMKKSGKGAAAIHKLISLVLSLCTLVLIATAISKMALYIDSYGLTPKRVYATWGMLVLALIFLLVIVKQFVPRLKLIASVTAVCVLMFAALALSNVDGYIAEYNVDRYIDGTLSEVDVDAIRDLGDAGVPQLVRLAKYMDEENGTDILSVKPEDIRDYGKLRTYYRLTATLHSFDYSDCELSGFTLPQSRAKAALEELGIKPWNGDQLYTAQSYLSDWYW